MKKLHTLCVSHNKIGVLRKDVDKTRNAEKLEFPSMKVFYGDFNGITSIADAELLKMPSLKYIFLQNNQIEDIKGDCEKINFHELCWQLQSNKYQKTFNLGIEDFPRLSTAVLDNNKIEKIPKNAFRSNKYLKTLFLENNQLTSLDFARELENVEKLYLASNEIQVNCENLLIK